MNVNDKNECFGQCKLMTCVPCAYGDGIENGQLEGYAKAKADIVAWLLSLKSCFDEGDAICEGKTRCVAACESTCIAIEIEESGAVEKWLAERGEQ